VHKILVNNQVTKCNGIRTLDLQKRNMIHRKSAASSGVNTVSYFTKRCSCPCVTKNRVMKMYPLLKNHATKTCWRENGGMALRILNFGTRWRWVVSFITWELYACEEDSAVSMG